MYVGSWLDDKENWYYPKSPKIIVEDTPHITINSDFETGYLIYGDNNGFDNPPRKDDLKIPAGDHQIYFKGIKDNSLSAQFYLLLYNDRELEKRLRISLNQKFNLQTRVTHSFKLALRIEGKGKLNIESMSLTKKYVSSEEEANILKLNKENYEHFEAILPNNHNPNYLEVVNQLINSNVFTFQKFGTVQYDQSIDWLEDFGKGRGYLRLLNGFVWLGDLTKVCKESKSNSIAERGLSLIFDWIDKNPYPGPRKNMAWHDETSALRLLNWTNFLFVVEEIIPHKNLKRLYLEIEKLVEILLSEEFYAGNNNHGMFQSFALIVYTNLFKKGKLNNVKDVAKGRLKKYFDYILSEEGVHKEHTPIYHYIIAANLKKYGEILIDKDGEFGGYLLQKYRDTLTYSTHIIKPNGYFPQIGDNENTKPVALGYKPLYNQDDYLYAITMGDEGIAPHINNIVFKKSGYAIFRNDWKVKEKATYLLFNAAYHTSYHKHSDDLSFILYSDGDIFIDSGPYGYDYGNEFTKYGYSSFAHNTLIVDNKSLPRVDKNYEATKITSYELNNEQSKVTGINKRYEDVTHERTILYNNHENIKVIDNIVSDNEHFYTLLFHVSQDIFPVIEESLIYLYRENVLIAIMEFNANFELERHLTLGKRENDSILGWHFEKFREGKPIHTISLSVNAKKLYVETNITLYT